MQLDVEVPVLRGFLTASEAQLWKRTVFGTAGEAAGGRLLTLVLRATVNGSGARSAAPRYGSYASARLYGNSRHSTR